LFEKAGFPNWSLDKVMCDQWPILHAYWASLRDGVELLGQNFFSGEAVSFSFLLGSPVWSNALLFTPAAKSELHLLHTGSISPEECKESWGLSCPSPSRKNRRFYFIY
jgi:hypothetical protein